MTYRILDSAGVLTLLDTLTAVRASLGGGPADWRVHEVGDGNLNLVFIVEGPTGSVCVKQALPYVRAAGPSWPMTAERALFEASYYRSVAPYVGARIPQIHHFESTLYCIVMERLSPHIILRQGLIAGQRYPRLAEAVGTYVADACFWTSDLAQPFERKMRNTAIFTRNEALVRITVDLVFNDPYRRSERNRHTSPQLDAVAAEVRRDGALKAAVARFGYKFLNEPQALLHGDLHSGSVMVTAEDTRVIDPEFAFYGPIGFDLGAFFGNLLLGWYSQAGYATAEDDRVAYKQWLLEQAAIFWTTFRARFLAVWVDHGDGDAFSARMFDAADVDILGTVRNTFMENLFADMIGFAACKMIRRILGFAHVADFERIDDPVLRGRCEASALAMARRLLTEPQRFRDVHSVLEAVPGVQS